MLFASFNGDDLCHYSEININFFMQFDCTQKEQNCPNSKVLYLSIV